MLVLSRKAGDRIQIGEDICVSITRISGTRVAIGLEAPREVSIRRDELGEKMKVDESSGSSKSASVQRHRASRWEN